MLKVALTGGIATGKSYVLGRIRNRGVATIDADDIVHEALGPGTPTMKAVVTQFGTNLLKPDGSIDRTLLAAMVFRDEDARLRLEAIVHPVVYERVRNWYATLDRPMGIASIPLLFETQREKDFNFVVVTACSSDQQLQRLLERDRMPEVEARQRIAAQMPTEEKVRRADFVILTGGTKLATDTQVEELLVVLSKVKVESKK